MPSQDLEDLADKLVDGASQGGCDGLMMTMIEYRTLKTNGKYCDLDVAESVYPNNGGWITQPSYWCVASAVSYGLQLLEEAGELTLLREEYLPEAFPGSVSFIFCWKRKKMLVKIAKLTVKSQLI